MALWLSEDDVRATIRPAELIGVMESALSAFSAGQVTQPVRTAFPIGEVSFFASMPAFSRERSLLGAKLLSVLPGNSARGLPTHLAVISLFDSTTGELRAVMDGRYITEVRTAAVSAASVRHMARANAATLAILGSGVQARSHLEAFSAVRNFTRIRAWSPTAGHLRKFVESASVRVEAASSPEDAVRDSDVVAVATNSITPVLMNSWVRDGTHVVAVGACRFNHQEIDPALVARAHLVVDSREAALREAGDILLPLGEGRLDERHIRAELGEVIAGGKSGRCADSQVTLFKSLGLAIEDLAAADLAWRRARDLGIGTKVKL